MSKENHGYCWSQKDESLLKDMLYNGKSYEEMAKKLGRSWYACKCRLIKLKLIPFQADTISRKTNVEKYDVPLRYVDRLKRQQIESSIDFYIKQGLPLIESLEDDTSRTFSDTELNVVEDYCKARLARLAVQKLNIEDKQLQRDIMQAEDFFTDEIKRVKIAKKMPICQRENSLTRMI